MAANSRLMMQLPMVDALDDQRGRSDIPPGFGQRLAGRHPCRVVQFGIADIEVLTVIRITYWTASNSVPGSQAGREQAVGQVGSNGRPPKGWRICTPITPEEVEFIGREREGQRRL